MLVRCTANSLDTLPDCRVRERLRQSIHLEGPDPLLVIGEVYQVVAIASWQDDGIRLYLHTVAESDHPYPYPIEMFEVVDPSLPVGWCIGFGRSEDGVCIEWIGFQEWAADPHFFEKLVDGDEAALRIYQHWRATTNTTEPSVPQDAVEGPADVTADLKRGDGAA